jgi:hypothetical protein
LGHLPSKENKHVFCQNSLFQNVIYIYGFADEWELKHIMGTSLDTTLGLGISVKWDNLQSDLTHIVKVKSEAVPVTGRGGPKGSETSKLPISRQTAHRWQ